MPSSKVSLPSGVTGTFMKKLMLCVMNVPVTPDGRLTFDDGISSPRKYVEMRALMDVYVLISNCPQLNNPCNAYNPTPIRVLIWDAAATRRLS